MKKFFLLVLLMLIGCTNERLIALKEQYKNVRAEIPNSCHFLSDYFRYDSDKNIQYISNIQYGKDWTDTNKTYQTLTIDTADNVFDKLLKACEICSEERPEDIAKYAQYKASILKVQKEKEEKVSDCKRAMEKAKLRNTELNNSEGNLMILDETITSNPENRTSNWSFCLKVIGYDNTGIVVRSGCTFSPLANLFLNPLIGCEEKEYFIYTDDDYADGECYKDWQYLHKDIGIYNWKNKRIRAFKKSNFKISEIEYQTYLYDKSLKCCTSDGAAGLCK